VRRHDGSSMKRLYLLRHAKSDWRDATLSDHDRPLNKRGQRDAPRIGAALAQRYAPMSFYLSSACRAQATYEGLCAGWHDLSNQQPRTDNVLYTFDMAVLLAWLSKQSDTQAEIALIAHNPALTDLINFLVAPDTLTNLPTAGWAALTLPITDWADIDQIRVQATLDETIFPKHLD
jgi:phosphohistidine phosphatase